MADFRPIEFCRFIGGFQKMTEMIELEEEELMKNEQDIETAAYKEAFDHFDWNHSGRIPTSVRLFQLWLACHL